MESFSEDLLKEYLLDANEHVESIENCVIDLEKGASAETIDQLFRIFHTLKGNSALLGQIEIRDLSHAIESTIGDVRNEEIDMSHGIADLILESVDQIKTMLLQLESAEKKITLDPSKLIEKINHCREQAPKKDTSELPIDIEAMIKDDTDPLSISEAEEAIKQQRMKVTTTGNLSIFEMPEFFTEALRDDFIGQIRTYQQQGAGNFIFNFKGTKKLTPEGVNITVTAYKEIETCNGKLAICGMSQKIHSLFNSSGVIDAITITPSLREAVLNINS